MTLRRSAENKTSGEEKASQRIDKWLWCARFVKTRTLAGKLAASGTIRLTRDGETTRVEKASALVRIGDRLAFLSGRRLRIIEVNAFGLRRGPAIEAQHLYTDHSPPPLKPDAPLATGAREKGAGRPTKKERRAIDRVRAAAPD